MSYTLLDLLVQWFPVADLPEHIIRTYLAGDTCLNNCDTIDKVFTKSYDGKETIVPEITFTYTYLDPERKILHSFNDKPALWAEHYNRNEMYWYRNGLCVRHIRVRK